jgi:hypothetical protein
MQEQVRCEMSGGSPIVDASHRFNYYADLIGRNLQEISAGVKLRQITGNVMT